MTKPLTMMIHEVRPLPLLLMLSKPSVFGAIEIFDASLISNSVSCLYCVIPDGFAVNGETSESRIDRCKLKAGKVKRNANQRENPGFVLARQPKKC